MHSSSMENMQRCIATYFSTSPIAKRKTVEILDIGGRDVNGSYADLFRAEKFNYQGVDIEAADGVSIVLDDPYKIPLADNSVDLILSGQMLEHCEFFWETFVEMMRVLKKDGLLFLIAPSSGPIHRYPVDCYRFYPDAYRALAKYAGCHLIDVWHDIRGPWNDLTGVFSKRKYKKRLPQSMVAHELASRANEFSGPPWPPKEVEVTFGESPYMETLEFLHRALEPKNYLEIGVRKGKSLALAKCPALGVDPLPDITSELGPNIRLKELPSDDFFALAEDPILNDGIDFAFIDGMHLFEYALRDFMHIERHAHTGTVVVIDDIFPGHPKQAARERETVHWTGDVWKLYEVLQNLRPDLTIIPLDTQPTGLLLICGLDPKNEVLWKIYNSVIARHIKREPPLSIIKRRGIISPNERAFKTAAQIIKVARENGVPLKSKTSQIRNALTL